MKSAVAILFALASLNVAAQGYGYQPVYTTATLPVCDTDHIYRIVYDSTVGALLRCDGAAWTRPAAGTAAQATVLATPRAINGVAFDGSAPITVPAAGSTLTDTVPITKGGTGTSGTLVGLVRGNSSAMTAAELSGDIVTSGSNVATLAAGSASNLNSGTLPAGRMPALTGDIAMTVGTVATTLATVASAGTTGSSTAIPVVTINAKGLTTGITTAAVVAPAGTLSGNTLNSTVTASSLTSFGAAPAIGAATGTSLAVTGALTSSGTAGIGYATGAGGTVTQATSKATGVTLSKMVGTITTNAAALAAATIVTFTVTNTLMTATDLAVCEHDSVGTTGAYTVNTNTSAAGSYKISLRNNTAGSLAEAIVLRCLILKGATS